MDRVRVLVVSHVRIYRDGVAEALRATRRFEAEVATPEHCIYGVETMAPDVVLHDVSPSASLAVVRALRARASAVRVVVLGVGRDSDDVVQWAEAGASGFVSRDDSLETLIRTIEAAARDELLCTPGIAAALCDRLASLSSQGPADAVLPLTRRERQIARFIEKGWTNKEIASQLFIEPATVKNHVHSLLQKLEIRRRGEVAARIRSLHPGMPTD